MAWGYLLLYKVLGSAEYKEKAYACLDWLDRNRELDQTGHSWGNHFDFTTRGGRMKAHTPTIVWSGLIGQAFLEAYEHTHDCQFLEIAKSICRWILTLPQEKTSTGICLSYTGVKQSSIHNSNLLGAGMLARTWKHTKNPEYLDVARQAVIYSCTRQRPDGSWWYGEDPMHHWIDNFHTGYNLDSLKRYIQCTEDTDFRPSLDKGYAYFKKVFFEDTGKPRYYHNRTYPVDIQCAAQAIDTFALFSDYDSEAISWAQKIAEWTIHHMQDGSGCFYYRQYPMILARTPYFHWGQATMFKALAHLLFQLESAPKPQAHSSLAFAP
ncbi:MAG TPA: hypothetical protein P5186_28300 [Candidatus Paceibacterota bacterium]|nr:hypothetical protein [Candidatus Paceibacterota bacterium]